MRVGAISCTPKFLLPNCFPYSSLARHPRAEPVGGQLCGIYRPKKAISHGNAPTIPRRFFLDTPQMGLSCCLTMATIVPKTIRGHRYYYLVQTAWVNGRSRYVKQLYLGKAEDIGKLFEEATAPVPTQGLPFEFGGTAALYSVAQQLQLAEIIDRHVPKRNQGLSVGQYALLAILNRCLAPTSKTQLAHW